MVNRHTVYTVTVVDAGDKIVVNQYHIGDNKHMILYYWMRLFPKAKSISVELLNQNQTTEINPQLFLPGI